MSHVKDREETAKGPHMIGKWIDSLTDEQRDRIIEHPDPTYRGDHWWDRVHDCGCLVGCVVGKGGRWRLGRPGVHRSPCPEAVLTATSGYRKYWYEAGIRFPYLTSRFGPERIWRACKLRAAKANGVALPEPDLEAVS